MSHAYQEQVQSDSISWEDIQKSLKPNEVAIEFVNFGYIDQYYALIIRKDYESPEYVYLKDLKRYPLEEKEFMKKYFIASKTTHPGFSFSQKSVIIFT